MDWEGEEGWQRKSPSVCTYGCSWGSRAALGREGPKEVWEWRWRLARAPTSFPLLFRSLVPWLPESSLRRKACISFHARVLPCLHLSPAVAPYPPQDDSLKRTEEARSPDNNTVPCLITRVFRTHLTCPPQEDSLKRTEEALSSLAAQRAEVEERQAAVKQQQEQREQQVGAGGDHADDLYEHVLELGEGRRIWDKEGDRAAGQLADVWGRHWALVGCKGWL